MTGRSLHIAWLGLGPAANRDGGAHGAATELLHGFAELGHRVDCFLPSEGHALPPQLVEHENIAFVWGTSGWTWQRWYSRTKLTAFASGLVARAIASLRLRRAVRRSHERDAYDLVYQFSSIESLSVPPAVTREVPLVIQPETHMAGELRGLWTERRLSMRCQPAHRYALILALLAFRALVQRIQIRRADLLVCISTVFRDHLVRDYGYPSEKTVVVPNPLRVARFAGVTAARSKPPTVLVLGRISVRKGIENVIELARMLHAEHFDVHFRVLGGPTLWSDYTKLLADLPSENAEFAGRVHPSEVPGELARSDVLLQPSKYEPFGMTVAEALAAGVPVVATSEVGAIDGVDRAVVAEVAVGDVPAMARAIKQTLSRLELDADDIAAAARAEAERLFDSPHVCAQISSAMDAVVDERRARSYRSAGAQV